MNGNRGEPLDELIARWSEAARVILNGELRTYAELAKHSSEYLLMPPNGGDPRKGFDDSDEAAAWWAQTFRDGLRGSTNLRPAADQRRLNSPAPRHDLHRAAD